MILLQVFAALILQGITQQSQPASIEGLVLRADTSEPLAKAQITATREGEPIGTPDAPAPVWSDAQGRFKVTIPRQGSYVIFAARNGFARQQYGERRPRRGGTALTISAGQKLTDIVFRMIPAGVVSGRISDSSGEALPGILVTLLRATYNQEGKRTFEEAASVPTDDHGDYRIPLVTPGRYFVKAVPPVISPYNQDELGNQVVEPGYVHTYYPGVPDSSHAVSVDIQAGMEAGAIDFKLSRQELFRVRGRLLDGETGKPPVMAFINIFPRDPNVSWDYGFSANYQSADGSFEWSDIPPGSYWIDARNSTFSKGRASRVAVDVAGSNVENAAMTLIPGFPLQGRIGFDGPPPSDPRLEYSLLNLIGTESNLPNFLTARPKSDGQFAFENVQPGNYRLNALFPCVTSARLADADLLTGAPISGPVDEPIEVVLCSKTAGALGGTTVDGDQKPMAGIQVVLIPNQRDRRDRYRTATSDQDGRFTIRNIPPGDYKVFAWEDLEPNSYRDPEVLRRYEALGKPVTIGESPSQAIQLKMIPAGM